MIDNSKPIQLLQNISLDDINSIGKSITVLAKFLQEKLSIPNGFIISRFGFNQYLDLTDLHKYFQTSSKDNDRADLGHAFEASTLPDQLKLEILNAYSKISGFTDAFVNLKGLILDKNSNELSHRTYNGFDIRGEKELVKAIEELYKEIVMDNVNVIEKFFTGEFTIVLSVQKSIQAEASGLMYTSDIITKDNARLIVEALYGLESGAALDGLVPDQYIFDKNTNTIKEKHISTQENMIVRQPGSTNTTQKVAISPAWQKRQKIDDKHIIVLAKTGLIIEEELNEPQIISWAYESGKIWITFVESSLKIEPFEIKKPSLQQTIDAEIENSLNGTDLNVHIPEEVAKNKAVLVDLILKDNKQEIKETPKMDTQNSINKKFQKEPLLEGAFGSGKDAQGEVVFAPEEAHISNILVLKGDEDISSGLKVAGFIIEDESEILAERLYEYFKVPVITGVPLARKILKEGEKIIIDGSNNHIYELVAYSEQLGEVQMSFTTVSEEKQSKSSFSFPVERSKNIEIQTQLSPKFLDDDEPDIEVIENDKVSESRSILSDISEVHIEQAAKKMPSLQTTSTLKSTLYEDQKVKIERKPIQTSFKSVEREKETDDSKDLSKLLDLVQEDSHEEIEEVINEKAQSDKEEVRGLNKNDQFKVWGKSLEKIISASKNVAPSTALHALEHVIDDSQDIIGESKEYTFDEEEKFIASKAVEVIPERTARKRQEFVPTATKVYAQLIDETLDEDIENFDGIVFTSTYEPEILIQYLEKTLEHSNEKEVLVIAPPYEEDALHKFFKSIYNIRNKGYRNISLILPDYRNKKEIAEYKKVLSISGLRRTSTFEVFANLSRTINVFRIDELDEEIIDGVYVDLFRLKMNMLGVEKLTASTKYVEGMKNLVTYIHDNMKLEGRSLINITGFDSYKKVLDNLSNYKFWGIVCEQKLVNVVKLQVHKLEQKIFDTPNNLLKSTRRRRADIK